MLIQYGYDITLNCAVPTPMVCFLAVHDDRADDLRIPEKMITTPDVAATTYRDSFGNVGRRLVAPAGDFSIKGEGAIEDSGTPDVGDWGAAEIPVADLPVICMWQAF